MPEQISFSCDLYDSDAVSSVAEAYGHLAKITIEKGPSETTVTFSEENPDHVAILYDSFSNHVLYETIIRVRKEAGGGMF